MGFSRLALTHPPSRPLAQRGALRNLHPFSGDWETPSQSHGPHCQARVSDHLPIRVVGNTSFDQCMASVGPGAAAGLRLRAVLLGAPGVGKGTVARKLSPHFNAPVISTGDIIREQIRIGSSNAKLLRHITDAGQLIPDDLVMEIVDEKLGSLRPDQNFILDGFPRTTTQANSLETFTNLNLVLKLHLPKEVLVQKITARRVCQNCGEGYNLADIEYEGVVLKPLLPKRPGFCDKCSGRLLQRRDDEELVVRRRLEVFQNETAPLKEFYRRKNILLNFCIYNGVKDLPLLISAVEKALNNGAASRE